MSSINFYCIYFVWLAAKPIFQVKYFHSQINSEKWNKLPFEMKRFAIVQWNDYIHYFRRCLYSSRQISGLDSGSYEKIISKLMRTCHHPLFMLQQMGFSKLSDFRTCRWFLVKQFWCSWNDIYNKKWFRDRMYWYFWSHCSLLTPLKVISWKH